VAGEGLQERLVVRPGDAVRRAGERAVERGVGGGGGGPPAPGAGVGAAAAGTDSAGVATARPLSITALGGRGTGFGLKMMLGTMAMTSIRKTATMTRR
jgi:hypothetical protein